MDTKCDPIRLQGIFKAVFHKSVNDTDSNSVDLNINFVQINELLIKMLSCLVDMP